MSDDQICGLLMLWLLAGFLGRSARSAFRTVILFIVLLVVVTSCTRGGYSYHEARLVGRSAAHSRGRHQRRRRHIWRVISRRQVHDYEADRRLRDHSELRRNQ